MARFKEPSRDSQLPAPAGRRASGSTGSVVEPKAADGGRTLHRPLFWRSTQPINDRAGDAIGEVVVYRSLSRELEIKRMTLEVQRLQSELETTCSFGGIIGSSAGIRRVCALLHRVAGTDVSVLVRGESGTGKELVAKALHFGGARRTRAFVAVDCAALPETLIESELLGYERGTFTGVTARRVGCFEEAEGSTLLLDEIGEMPLTLQAKLLRVPATAGTFAGLAERPPSPSTSASSRPRTGIWRRPYGLARSRKTCTIASRRSPSCSHR